MQVTGPVALGRIFVYFAKKTVNECCQMSVTSVFRLDKILPNLTKLQRIGMPLGLTNFLSGD